MRERLSGQLDTEISGLYWQREQPHSRLDTEIRRVGNFALAIFPSSATRRGERWIVSRWSAALLFLTSAAAGEAIYRRARAIICIASLACRGFSLPRRVARQEWHFAIERLRDRIEFRASVRRRAIKPAIDRRPASPRRAFLTSTATLLPRY